MDNIKIAFWAVISFFQHNKKIMWACIGAAAMLAVMIFFKSCV